MDKHDKSLLLDKLVGLVYWYSWRILATMCITLLFTCLRRESNGGALYGYQCTFSKPGFPFLDVNQLQRSMLKQHIRKKSLIAHKEETLDDRLYNAHPVLFVKLAVSHIQFL